MRSIINRLARCYFSSFPIERGKWRLWLHFLARSGFREVPAGVQRLKYGIRMHLDPSNFIELFSYYWSCWEPDETWVVRRLLRPGDIFVDLGANIGYFSLIAAQSVGEEGRVIALEPVPPTVQKLRRNLDLNPMKNITLYEFAVSDRTGSVRIYQPHDNNIGANSVRPGDGNAPHWDVPSVTLDELLEGCPPVRLVKIDLEGAELLAIRGFTRHLADPTGPAVLCEVTDRFLRELGSDARQLLTLMSDLGYLAYRFENRRLSPVSVAALEQSGQLNVLFLKAFQTIELGRGQHSFSVKAKTQISSRSAS